MKIYTRTGDQGETSLLRGGRVPKYHLRVESYGTFDELNSWIGFVISLCDEEEIRTTLIGLQPSLHVLCSDVAADYVEGKQSKRVPRISEKNVEELEKAIDRMDQELPALTHFILPGGSKGGAALHVARTICRRGERTLVELTSEVGKVNPWVVKYVNRLSDYLFTLARYANFLSGSEETAWVDATK